MTVACALPSDVRFIAHGNVRAPKVQLASAARWRKCSDALGGPGFVEPLSARSRKLEQALVGFESCAVADSLGGGTLPRSLTVGARSIALL